VCAVHGRLPDDWYADDWYAHELPYHQLPHDHADHARHHHADGVAPVDRAAAMETKMVTINETKVFFVFTLWLAQKGGQEQSSKQKGIRVATAS